MAPERLRAALCACGGIAPLTLDAAASSPDFEVVALQDPDPNALEAVGLRYGIDRRHTRLEDLLAEEVDFVVINSPNHLHQPQALAALAAGRHVLVQKPMARTVAEAESMARAAATAGLRLGVTLFELGKPLHHELRSMREAGWFGSPTLVQAMASHTLYLKHPPAEGDWRRAEERIGGGAFLQLGLHHLNLACWLLGQEVVSVTALGKSGETVFRDETSAVAAHLCGGSIAHFAASYAADGYVFAIYGTEGRALLSTDHVLLQGERPWNGRLLRYERPGPEAMYPRALLSAAERELASPLEVHGAFARSLRGGPDYPGSAERGIQDLKVVEAVRRSIQAGRSVSIE